LIARKLDPNKTEEQETFPWFEISRYNACLKIIFKFCEKPEKVQWDKEIRIANLLIIDHGTEVFKRLIPEAMGFEMKSLAAFRTEKFKAFLDKQTKLLKIDFRKERAIIGKAKVGEDKPTKRKPKTLLNFLNYDSKEENKTTG
jgi:hypothetical protein